VSPGSVPGRPLFLGTDDDAARALAAALDAEVLRLPAYEPGDGWDWSWSAVLEGWRAGAARGEIADHVVVCTWAPAPVRTLLDTSRETWLAEAEWWIALGYVALDVALARCRDGGSVVVVVERPAALDAAGHATTVAVADGRLALSRSLALAHGGRGVRVNAVTTEVSTAPAVLLGSPPPLAAFPGTVEREVAGAVRLLLSPDAVGITGTVVRADCGRAW
jgi:enoyl-[acyl-carrier-protein] reductase (NADH)